MLRRSLSVMQDLFFGYFTKLYHLQKLPTTRGEEQEHKQVWIREEKDMAYFK
jgi:hypothetical protein